MKRSLLFVLLLYYCFGVYAQDLKRLVPPNPNVASLMKATLTPVTEYAGLPNVAIPIYTINEGDINIPISLSYHTGGIQVAEESGSVGLGWTLNVGGLITRSINGYGDFGEGSIGTGYSGMGSTPDPVLTAEGSVNYFDPIKDPYVIGNTNCEFNVDGTPKYFDIIKLLHERIYEYTPDTYYYNFNGYSGSFIIKQDGSFFTTDKNTLKIAGQGRNLGFTITTGDGSIYEFKTLGETLTNISASSGAPIFTYVSSWYLTKISSINGNTVNFIYDKKGKSYPLRSFTQEYYINQGTGGANEFKNFSGPQSVVDDIYLTEVKFTNGSVFFNYSSKDERQDIRTAYYLNNIEVYNKQELIKKYEFNYSYFGSSPVKLLKTYQGGYGGDIHFDGGSNPHPNLRLRLDEFKEVNNEKKYSFEYFDAINPGLTPNKTTMSQDYWGFYNGITNLTSFIPYVDGRNGDIPIKAKRFPVEKNAKLFSLKKIIYPTKGFTEFDYELNTYDHTFDHIPISDLPPSVPTVERTDQATTLGGGQWVIKEIHPEKKLKVRFNLAIYGSNVSENCDALGPTRCDHPFQFEFDMLARIRDISTQKIIWERSFVPSEQAFDDFKNYGQVFFSEMIEFPFRPFGVSGPYYPISTRGYTLEVYFDSDIGDAKYFGMSQVLATWEQVSQSELEKFSFGGGLRIKSIIDSDSRGQLKKRNFNYHYTELDYKGVEIEKSYGKIIEMPNFTVDILANGVVAGKQFNVKIGEATSHHSLSKNMGSYVGYSQVETTFEDEDENDNNNGKIVSKFYNLEGYYSYGNFLAERLNMYKFPPINLPYNGFIYKQEYYKRNDITENSYTLVKDIYNEYVLNNNTLVNNNDNIELAFTNFFKSTGSNFVMSGRLDKMPTMVGDEPCVGLTFFFQPLYSSLVNRSLQKETIYDINGENPITTTANYFYDNDEHLQLTRTETTDSKSNLIKTNIEYPQDIPVADRTPAENGLIAQHQISMPIQTETTVTDVDGNELSKTIQRTNYRDWGLNGAGTSNIILPEFVQTVKGEVTVDNPLENRITYHDYDDQGNPLEVSKTDGTHITYIWGYNQQYPVAKVENATHSQVVAILTSTELTNIKEGNYDDVTMRSTLSKIRTLLTDSQVTTYTYDPLIGVTSITDPRDYTIYYEYDDFNRLKQVKDAEGNILSKNEYHYKD